MGTPLKPPNVVLDVVKVYLSYCTYLLYVYFLTQIKSLHTLYCAYVPEIAYSAVFVFVGTGIYRYCTYQPT